MLKNKILIFLSLLFTLQVFADVTVIEPRDCKFFNALTAGSDRNSTDTAAFGKPFDLLKMGRLSVQVIWASLTGSVDGTVKVQVSSVPLPSTSDWLDKAGATFTMSGASGTNLINITIMGERWARVVYTHNSVSGGTVTGYCHGKSI